MAVRSRLRARHRNGHRRSRPRRPRPGRGAIRRRGRRDGVPRDGRICPGSGAGTRSKDRDGVRRCPAGPAPLPTRRGRPGGPWERSAPGGDSSLGGATDARRLGLQTRYILLDHPSARNLALPARERQRRAYSVDRPSRRSDPLSVHPALSAGRVAVVTGAASGIGLAAARRFAALGLRVCLADLSPEVFGRGADEVAAASAARRAAVLAVPSDVSKLESVHALKDKVYAAFGEVAVLMNNAGTAPGGGPWDHIERWRRVLEVNLWGVIHGVQTFVPAMLAQKNACAIINTGSKQGITCPPGDTAYNVSKAGVKVLTEALAHSLRNEEGARISAHLLIPGSTFTGMTSRGRREKPAGAWTPDQVIDMLIAGMNDRDFYILCPDNEVTRAVDVRRILWAAGDITENRPALSRWHADYKDAFDKFLHAED